MMIQVVEDILRQLSIYAIIVLCITLLNGLYALYYQTREWRYLSLMLIPFAFLSVYIWIGVMAPPGERIRDVIRSVVIFSSLNATHVVFSYLERLRRILKRREDIKS